MSESALKESEERYRRIVEDFTGFIVRWRADGKRTFVSDSYCQYFGITQEMARNSDFMFLIYPPDREMVKEKIRSLTPNNPVAVNEHRVIHKDGTVRWMEWTDRAIFDEKGVIKEYQSIGYDIDERKRTSELLNQAILKAEAASRAKSQFLATVSHEIRTPLNSIVGYTDLLQETNLSDEQKSFAKRIKSSSRLLVTLLTDILDISRIEAHGIAFEHELVNANVLLDDIINICRWDAEKKGISLVYESSTPCHVMIDPRRIRQIVLNLVNNAIKFTSHGVVKIACNRIPETKTLVITVTDTGIGIAPEDRERIFDAFFQVDMSSTRRYEGVGLGLHLVKRILEALGGEILVESELGRGTRFTVYIPYVEKEEGEA